MQGEIEFPSREPMIRLLNMAFEQFAEEVRERISAAGFGDIRPGHGCVFGTIDPQGSRLTDLAERAHMTKQSVGEAASDLERRGYVDRARSRGLRDRPPADRRARA